jgi:hypothetical protein
LAAQEIHDFSTEDEELVVTAWHCGRCGRMMEEIMMWADDRATSHRIAYAVQPALAGIC